MALLALDINQTNFTVKIFADMCNRNARYVFSLYDKEHIKGQIHLKTILQILKDTHDEKTLPNAQKIIAQIQNELQTQIKMTTSFNEIEFVKLAQAHYELLLPAYVVQTQMRRAVLGLKYWTGAMQKRSQVADKEYLDMSAYLFLLRKSAHLSAPLLKIKPKYVVCDDEEGDADFFKGGILPDKCHKADQCQTSGTTRTTDTASTYSRASRGAAATPSSAHSHSSVRSGASVSIDVRAVIPIGGAGKSTTSTKNGSGSDSDKDFTPPKMSMQLSFRNIKEHFVPEEEEARKLRVFPAIRIKTHESSVSIDRDVFVLDMSIAPLRNKRIRTQEKGDFDI
eukprot:gene24628-30996_t